ncbi:hypothetical protein BKA64DRAFT_699226 [Cadophora sp. MPI-SDFR-AT-0126]|nr:hypothetical protein BKA64DRAFT_699226 [Leotiomycetes sp. MPI-SDFR-AT-0126]
MTGVRHKNPDHVKKRVPGRSLDANGSYECAHGCGTMYTLTHRTPTDLKKHEDNCSMRNNPGQLWGPFSLDPRGDMICRRGCGFSSRNYSSMRVHETKRCPIFTGKPRLQKDITKQKKKDESMPDIPLPTGPYKRTASNWYICRRGCGNSMRTLTNITRHEKDCGKPEQEKSGSTLAKEKRIASALAYPFIGETENPLLLGISYQTWRVDTLGPDYFDIPDGNPLMPINDKVRKDYQLIGDAHNVAEYLEDSDTESLDDAEVEIEEDGEDQYQEVDERDDNGVDENGETWRGGWSFNGKKYDTIALRNQAVLKVPDIPAPPQGLCPGIVWTHGLIECQEKATLGITNWSFRGDRHVKTVYNGKSYNQPWELYCYSCHVFKRTIRRWESEERYKDGKLLCSQYRHCRELVVDGGVLCEKHRETLRQGRSQGKQKQLMVNPKRNSVGKPGDGISTSTDLRSFLEALVQQGSKKAVPNVHWNRVLDAMEFDDVHHDVYFMDLEFCTLDGGVALFEISVLSHNGETLLDTTIDPGITPEELVDFAATQSESRRVLIEAIVKKWTKKSNLKDLPDRFNGMPIADVVDQMKALGINKNSVILQWSVCRTEYHVIHKNMPDADFPPKAQWLDCIPVWRRVIPGLFTFALATVFPFFFPDEKRLCNNAHRAEVDARKLFLMIVELVKYVKKV